MEVLLNNHIAARGERRILASYEGGINRVLTLGIFRPVDEANEVAAVKVTKPMNLVNRADCGSKPSHNLRRQLEAQVHALRPNMPEHVARRRDGMTLSRPYLAKLVQLSWPRLPEYLVPGIGSKLQNTGKRSFLFTKSYRAHERG